MDRLGIMMVVLGTWLVMYGVLRALWGKRRGD